MSKSCQPSLGPLGPNARSPRLTQSTTHHALREAFLRFFEAHDHRRHASASLIPQSDPTLLFTNAGMNQFKKYFLGEEKPEHPRAATTQKCVRAGGKHNDLENVGYTARHHTFFEMLGNFSFGDYFKKEAVDLGWEFVTKTIGLPVDRLIVTVFKGEDGIPADDEAAKLWAAVGVPSERIVRLGMKDNFWAMGDTGPCGPCSEIHYYQGDLSPAAALKIFDTPAAEDQWIEIWNLVFMQFNRDDKGVYNPLPKPSVDTGMGLERLCAVVQGRAAGKVFSNYDTDLFLPILAAIGKVLNVRYGADIDTDTAMRVIADHARAATFLIADGVLPDNEGRGYVLRRIMRRAIRYGRKIGATKPFLADICRSVAAEMQKPFPDTAAQIETVAKIVTLEEERFGETLDRGLNLFTTALAAAKAAGKGTIPGEVVFRLYDTYGFPVDLTELLAREAGIDLDMAGFESAMNEQRERARAEGAAKKGTGAQTTELFDKYGATMFTGYNDLGGRGKLLAVLDGKDGADAVLRVVLDRTPFYAESGGQIADRGELIWEGGRARVVDVQKAPGGVFVHSLRCDGAKPKAGADVELTVDRSWRRRTTTHHTATHMLQAALRETLGTHVRQAGSLVEPDRLRFDFSHFSGLAAEERLAIENRVNEKIREDIGLQIAEMSYDDAIAKGAMAFFGEKYGAIVRVVDIPGFSVELCGGTHVQSTGQIGAFLFDSEGSVSAGVRRVEALVAEAALGKVRQLENELSTVAGKLHVPKKELIRKIDAMLASLDASERELAKLRKKLAGDVAKDLHNQVETIGAYRVLAADVPAQNPAELRELCDRLRVDLPDAVLCLASGEGEQPSLYVSVPAKLEKELHAGNLLKVAAGIMGGRGGGKPGQAQGGGGDPAKIAAALAAFKDAIAK